MSGGDTTRVAQATGAEPSQTGKIEADVEARRNLTFAAVLLRSTLSQLISVQSIITLLPILHQAHLDLSSLSDTPLR